MVSEEAENAFKAVKAVVSKQKDERPIPMPMALALYPEETENSAIEAQRYKRRSKFMEVAQELNNPFGRIPLKSDDTFLTATHKLTYPLPMIHSIDDEQPTDHLETVKSHLESISKQAKFAHKAIKLIELKRKQKDNGTSPLPRSLVRCLKRLLFFLTQLDTDTENFDIEMKVYRKRRESGMCTST